MKRVILSCLLMSLWFLAFGQAKKPSLMVVPSDLWCHQNGYLKTEDNLGESVQVPDYKTALVTNTDLLPVIARINGLMADRGFPLKNLESEMKSLNVNSAEMSAITNKDGAAVKTSTLEQLRQRSRADIIIQLTWTVNQMGPKRSITYTLQGLDSYTNKEVATTTGTGDPSFTAELPVLLAEAVSSHMDEFCERLQNHFDDLLTNGREISLNIRIFDNPEEKDLETEFNGTELREIIENWIYDHTVSHRFSLADDSEVYMNFDEVRIPIYDENDRAMSAANFARQLEKYLKTEYDIPIKRDNPGLGQANLFLFK